MLIDSTKGKQTANDKLEANIFTYIKRKIGL